jgi:hypothetical protein
MTTIGRRVVACFRTDRTQALQPVAHITPPFGRTEAGVSETSSILFFGSTAPVVKKVKLETWRRRTEESLLVWRS